MAPHLGPATSAPAFPPPSPAAGRTSRAASAPATRAPSAPAATRRTRGPDLSRTAPPSTPTARERAAGGTGPNPAPGRAVIRIGGWSSYVARGDQSDVDACRDAVQWAGPEIGREDGYEMETLVIVGHDYCNGFDRFADLPVGTRVTLTTVRGSRTYEVYANYVTPGRGVPAAGLYWGDLTLQSCVGPDTGFSYLLRI
ncbi:hypothetical protein GCM10017589_04180 [Streptomyces poonensis]|uniref:hypothetical protein n=1 Tax=Streptomyces poonensis TaxID=68255 RepID=UPI0022F323A3|nr:hypothetical protein [Streptomyces poonensis]GLJ87818.1 hypothetical protein GCM10017589_04180 [Streptomyces poonensis]